MMKGLFALLMASSILLGACTGVSRASENKTDAQVGECHFHLPASKIWHFAKVEGKKVNLEYVYSYNGKIYNANLDLRCGGKSLSQSLPDDFSRSGDDWVFEGGSAGGSKTSEIKGKNWRGFRAEYFMNSPCVFFIGTAGNENSFTLNICDSEETLPSQLKVLDEMFSEFESE